ncbi:MAG TPA: ABC transporter permease [Xanthobacteraceae bacterium]|jgi:ribose/xylose/arabinose/galactoside ABC-type transport system permease subunit
MLSIVSSPSIRPYLLLAIVILLLAAVDFGHGRFLSLGTAYSALQSFSTFGLVALGLGLVMLIGEFDLSVAGVFGLAGCIALLTGPDHFWVGMLCAVGTGAAFGFGQGLLIVLLDLGSVPITLGGLLTATGIAYVITHNRAISSDNLDLAMTLNDPVVGLFSLRSLVALGIFVVAAAIFATTRLGRDLIATGSDRKAAIIAGVSVKKLLLGAFAFSGFMAAMGGAMLSYGLASATPSGLADVLVPAAAAAILGGVSLAGGSGTPLGIVAGILTLTVLRSGLNAVAAPPFAHDLATGLILFAVAVFDAPYLWRRWAALHIHFVYYQDK